MVERETMKTMMLAAAVALTLSAGVANAENEGGSSPVANTLFTSNPSYIGQAPVQSAPPVASAQNGQSVGVYGTKSDHGTWLFAPYEGRG
jgi:hypothetical protein